MHRMHAVIMDSTLEVRLGKVRQKNQTSRVYSLKVVPVIARRPFEGRQTYNDMNQSGTFERIHECHKV